MTEPHDENQPEATTDELDHDALRRERDQAQDQLKRSLADLANVRRRHQQELLRAQGVALEALAHDLLPVIDHFEAALASRQNTGSSEQPAVPIEEELAGLVQGVQMVRALLAEALARHGLREVPAAGEPFDPNVHEAVGLDPTSDVAPGHVARVLQAGYHLGDRLLRPSRVLVKGPADPTADAAGSSATPEAD